MGTSLARPFVVVMNTAATQPTKRVYVCHGPNCAKLPVRQIWNVLEAEVVAAGIADQCELIVSGCQSRCEDGPNINVYPNLTKYAHVQPDQIDRIVHEHLVGGQPVEELRYDERW